MNPHPPSNPDRRCLLLAAGAAGLAASPLSALAQAGALPVLSWKTEFRQIFPNIYAFIRGGGTGVASGGLSNAGAIIGPDNVTLVDAMGPPVHAKEFKRAVQGVTTKPITRVINTHHHRDHTNGNYLFQPAEIVMTPMMARLVKEDGIPEHPWANRPSFLEGIEELRYAPPTTLIKGDVSYMFGDLEVQVISPGAGHTFGDLMVYVPRHKLLFAGDIAFFGVAPALHTSDPAHWLQICDQVQKMDVETIVPGHGPIGGKKDLKDMADFIGVMERELRKGYDAGKSPGRAAAEAKVGRFANWADQERLAWAAPRLYTLWRTGSVPPEADTAGQDKAVAEYHALVGG